MAALDGRIHSATQHYPVSRRHRLDVQRIGGGYQLLEDRRELDRLPDACSAAGALVFRMHTVALEAVSDLTKLHAGCTAIDGGHLVIVGGTCTGKTTLMTRLLFEGFSAGGDDLLLLRGGQVIPFPRRFRLRSEALSLLPEIASMAQQLPHDAGRLALNPRQAGFRWEIGFARAAAIVLLERGDSGRAAELEICPKHVTARRIMAQSNPPSRGPGAWVADVCALVESAPCYVLYSGSLSSSAEALRGLMGKKGDDRTHG
jgi:hypothetical protein